MNLTDDLHRIIKLFHENPSLVAEAEFKPLVNNLQKATSGLLAKADRYSGVNWTVLIELRVALKAIKAKQIPDINRRLKRFGISVPAQPNLRAEFALQCARRSDASDILTEVSKTPEDLLKEEYYSIVRMDKRAAEQKLVSLSDAELAEFVKRHKIPVKKKREGKKSVIDKNGTINAILLKIEKDRLATQA